MSKIILTGATGNAGSAILSAALASPDVSRLTVITRRPPTQTHAKLDVILLPSTEYPGTFDNLPSSIIDLVRDHRAIIWAQGMLPRQGNSPDYSLVTHDYPLAAARAFSQFGTPSDPFRSVYLSGVWASQSEGAPLHFRRVKGRTEKDLFEMETPSFRAISVRAGGFIPTKEHVGQLPWDMRLVYWHLSPFWELVMPSKMIKTTDLGRVMVKLALGEGWEQRLEDGTLSNRQLKAMS